MSQTLLQQFDLFLEGKAPYLIEKYLCFGLKLSGLTMVYNMGTMNGL
jgi:hypothetical protein